MVKFSEDMMVSPLEVVIPGDEMVSEAKGRDTGLSIVSGPQPPSKSKTIRISFFMVNHQLYSISFGSIRGENRSQQAEIQANQEISEKSEKRENYTAND